VKCNHNGSDDLCQLCTHAAEHDHLVVWKEPDKMCDNEHKCEASGKIVKCEEQK